MEKISINKNFRSWKSGKKWLYKSCAFFLVIGGATEPIAMVFGDVIQAKKAISEQYIYPISSETVENGHDFKIEQSSQKISASSIENSSIDKTRSNLIQSSKEENATIKSVDDHGTTTSEIDSWMPDKKLQEILQGILGKSNFTKEDLLSVTSINLSNQTISNLKGLNFAKNLTSIVADSTDLSNTENLSEVGELSNLTEITATNCNLSTVDFMKNANLDKLTEIDLSNNKIKNLNGLKGLSLPELTSMKITNNLIDDISIITAIHVPKLEKLNADYNIISDISPIVSSTLLNLKVLSVSHNDIADISYFSNSTFTKLEELDVSYNLIDNIDVMKNLSKKYPNLHLFKVNNNNISDISFMIGYSLNDGTNATSQQSNLSLTLIRPNDLNALTSIEIPIRTTNFQKNSDTGFYDGLPDTNASTLTIKNINGAKTVTDYSGESYDITSDFYKTSVKTLNISSDTKEITYSWSGAQGQFSGDGVIKINWVNSVAPVIEASDKVIYQGDHFNPNENVIGYDQQLDGSARNDLTDDIKIVSNNINNNIPGEYTVTYSLKNSFGIETEKTIRVTVKANKQSITGSNYTMTVGDKQPSVSDFKASATDKNGNPLNVKVDFSKVDFTKAGTYDVVLNTTDGQNKTVKLSLKEKKHTINNNKKKNAPSSGQSKSMNDSKTKLPSTGEQKSSLLYGIGAMLIVLAVAIYGGLKKYKIK